MTHCFLCYHQHDQALVQTLKTTLEAWEIPVWVDMEKTHAHSIWSMAVEQALRKAFAVVVVMSPAAEACQYVTYEWAFALGAGVRVIPLLVEQTDWHPRLTHLSYLDFTKPSTAAWDDLQLLLRQSFGKVEYGHEPSHEQAREKEPPTSTASLGEQSQHVVTPAVSRDSHITELQADHSAVQETLAESLRHPMRDVRIQASLMLAQFKDVQAIPVLIDALHDRDRDVYQHAAWGLLHIGKPAVPALIAALQDEQRVIRKDVARILGQIGDSEAVAALIAILQDSSYEVRRAAAEALGQLRDATAVVPLRSLLQDEHETVRRSVAESLGQIGEPIAVTDLISALEDECESVRVVAAWSLGQMRDAAAVPALVEALRSANPQLRQAAVEVLKDIGDISVKTSLTSVLQDEDTEVRRAAARVLAHIRGQQRGIS
jgi:HEAT repeat protein